MNKSIWMALVLAIGCGGARGPAVAAEIFVSNMALPYYQIVDLAGGRLGTQHGVYAGQQVLTANNGSTYNASATFTQYAWCVDFAHDIYIGGNSIDYTLATLSDDHLGATPGTSNPLTAATVDVTRDARNASVHITGRVTVLLPGFHVAVQTTATGPVTAFRP